MMKKEKKEWEMLVACCAKTIQSFKSHLRATREEQPALGSKH